jgi:hypothetical protein
MLLDLSSRDRHAAIKAVLLALAAMDAVPERRRPKIDRENAANLLAQLQASSEETELYTRAADWVVREIAEAGMAGFPGSASVNVAVHGVRAPR